MGVTKVLILQNISLAGISNRDYCYHLVSCTDNITVGGALVKSSLRTYFYSLYTLSVQFH